MKELYRRSPHLVCYWQEQQLVFENYARRTRVAAAPPTCEILHLFGRWRPAAALAERFPDSSAASLARAMASLIRVGLLERSSDSRNKSAAGSDREKSEALSSWIDWSPAASFFHFSTKNSHAPIGTASSVRELRRRARINPPPASEKRYPKAPQIALPAPATAGEFPQVLLQRRTWRQFSRDEIELEKLSTLLGLTFGVRWWFDLRGIGRVALKTSPSGGARHPIEAYVVALRVKGLPRGIYHYAAGAHRLELLRRGATKAQIVRYLNGQEYFGNAAALVLMTAVFARTQWKYPGSRAYRVVLIDAGHVCQTFCLAATWLGLAPFCTMALTDAGIEKDLGIDGVRESAIYSAGVGVAPEGTDWAPWPDSHRYGSRHPNRSS